MPNNTAIADALVAGAVAALVRGRAGGACSMVLDCLLRQQRLMRADFDLEQAPVTIVPVKQGFRIAVHGLDPIVINNLKYSALATSKVFARSARATQFWLAGAD